MIIIKFAIDDVHLTAKKDFYCLLMLQNLE